MDAYQQQAKIFQALAHPARLHILSFLAREEVCVCHLTAALGKRQPYISQHLAILRKAGLVTDRKDGLMVYYRLDDDQIRDLLKVGLDIVRNQGTDIKLDPVLTPPLSGCTCPLCRGQTTSTRE